MARTYEYNVKMSCGGCKSSISQAVSGMSGVQSVNIDIESQTVTVTADDRVTFDMIPASLKTIGKEVNAGKLVVPKA